MRNHATITKTGLIKQPKEQLPENRRKTIKSAVRRAVREYKEAYEWLAQQ
jgi:hypothetical protein